MQINGVDLSALGSHGLTFPKTVAGRVVHIDADFLAYMVAADEGTPENPKTLAEMKHNAEEKIQKVILMAGAEKSVLHLTPKNSDKGGRNDIALLKEYQGKRKNKPKPKFLHVIRDWMHTELNGIMHMHCEADDGMAMAQYKLLDTSNRNLSVIASKDKDLTMVPGLQLDWDTGEISDTNNHFGWINLTQTKSGTKKVVGRGWKFFWAQMLMGDAADDITGLPAYCVLSKKPVKPKKVGPVFAYDLLEPCKTNKEAFELVRDLYKAYDVWHVQNELPSYQNYRDGSTITAYQAFISNAQLLWMRRNPGADDVINWLKETCV